MTKTPYLAHLVGAVIVAGLLSSCLSDAQRRNQGSASQSDSTSTARASVGDDTTILTNSEVDVVLRQIERCWAPPVLNTSPSFGTDLIVHIDVDMNSNGTVRDARVAKSARSADPNYLTVADGALRAVLDPRCQPFKLPPQKYAQWQTMSLSFNPKDKL